MDNVFLETEQKLEKLMNIIYRYKSIMNKTFKVNANSLGEVSVRQHHVMIALGHFKLKTISEISDVCGVSSSSLSTVISKMHLNGYVEKKQNRGESDKRKATLTLTENGYQLLHKMDKKMMQAFEFFYSYLSDEQKELFVKALQTFERVDSPKSKIKALTSSRDIAMHIYKKFIEFASLNHDYIYNNIHVRNNEGQKLSTRQYHILYIIRNTKYNTLSQLEPLTDVSPGSLSTTISKLCEGGFLRKEYPDPTSSITDKRVNYLFITEKGSQMADMIQNNMKKTFQAYWDKLNKQQREDLNLGIDLLYRLFLSLLIQEEENNMSAAASNKSK